MTTSKALLGAVLLAGGLTIGSLTASAAEMPSSFVLAAAPHEVTTTMVKQTLEGLGFTDVGDIHKDGRIFRANATWDGDRVGLRINTRHYSIREDDLVPPLNYFPFVS